MTIARRHASANSEVLPYADLEPRSVDDALKGAYRSRKKSSKQSECNHVPRDLAVLVHWVHHPRFGDFLIDAGFDDSFAKHPPYGNYTQAMALFNWANGVTNRQSHGEDLASQLVRLNVHPKAVFRTSFQLVNAAGGTRYGATTKRWNPLRKR